MIGILTVDTAFSQFNFVFLPEVYGRSVDGLSNFQIQNLTSQVRAGQMHITVRENISKTRVLTMISPEISISPGSSTFPVNAYAASSFNFSNTPLGAIASQTRNFPPGEYTFCFRFVPADKGDDYENCFDASIQPLVPISLINPADQDKICQKRPPLSWQPPVPFPPNMRFRLLLTDKKGGAAVENLLMNTPLILLDNIPSTMISYPSSAPDLKEGHTYCWQVIAYQNGVIISRSEIWEFTVQCNDPVASDPKDSYRELKLMVNGNYYYANRVLRFSFNNKYNVKKLDYMIYDAENGDARIRHLPEIAIAPGLNKIDIDLTDLGMGTGKHYTIKVFPFNEPEVAVRFIYQENESSN
jgi:hypothetical protein